MLAETDVFVNLCVNMKCRLHELLRGQQLTRNEILKNDYEQRQDQDHAVNL